MYKLVLQITIFLILLASCSPTPKILLTNPLDVSRTDEPLILDKTDFENRYETRPTGTLPFLKTESGEYIPVQFDDLDGDNQWDEMAFLVNLDAGSRTELLIEWLPAEKAPVFPKRTQVYLGQAQADGSFRELTQATAALGLDGFPSPYQAEGVSWENDKMAFRVYFDCRNVKDLFGKLTPDLIAHKAGTPELGSYHELGDWGMDILHCGSSLGAGGLAMLERDTLFRLGSTDKYQYKEIVDGPVRSIFELSYEGWGVGDQRLTATERITIWAGKYWFKSEVLASGYSEDKELVTGIVTSKMDREPERFVANQEYTAILAHGKQSLNKDFLAMAVLAPTKEVTKIAHSGNTNYFLLGDQRVPSKNFSHQVSETYYLSQKISENHLSTHYFFSMWGLENSLWNESEAVKQYLISEANRFSAPIQIDN